MEPVARTDLRLDFKDLSSRLFQNSDPHLRLKPALTAQMLGEDLDRLLDPKDLAEGGIKG